MNGLGSPESVDLWRYWLVRLFVAILRQRTDLVAHLVDEARAAKLFPGALGGT